MNNLTEDIRSDLTKIFSERNEVHEDNENGSGFDFTIDRKTTLSWWGDEGELTSEQKDELKEHGFSRVNEMVADGYSEGELNTSLIINNTEIEVQGYWKISERGY